MLIRPARADDVDAIAYVHVESWRSSYCGIIPDEILDNLSIERRAQVWYEAIVTPLEHTCVFVAEDVTRNIAGFATGGPERENTPGYSGELYAIYLLESAQGKGLGSALVTTVAGFLLEHGMNNMLVWVLKDNPGCAFYERLGGVYLKEKPITIGSAALVEVAYGWTDTTPLAGDTQIHLKTD